MTVEVASISLARFIEFKSVLMAAWIYMYSCTETSKLAKLLLGKKNKQTTCYLTSSLYNQT